MYFMEMWMHSRTVSLEDCDAQGIRCFTSPLNLKIIFSADGDSTLSLPRPYYGTDSFLQRPNLLRYFISQ